MGKTMKKSSVIWGDRHAVTLAQFNDSHMQAIEKEVRLHIGPKAAFSKSAAQAVIKNAKLNPKMKNAYVKVGLIDGALVFRAKEKKFIGDVEMDAVLVTDFKTKSATFRQQMLDEFANEFKKQQEELKKLKTEKERQEKLKEVMNRKDKSGESLRDRILRAAQTAQKLGIGNYAQTKLKLQGLQAMDPLYHGEVLDRHKNRYARYMGPLKAIWDRDIDGQMSFSDWLDAVEANDVSVKGVNEARTLTNKEIAGDGKIVQPGGLAGGRVVYLNDEDRKAYVATASKGGLTGPSVKNGDLIFVIGPDSKLYVGSKNRAAPGKREAFNHSSFFSGAPVKSAGTLKVAGGKVVAINDQSGHYAPNRNMVMMAIRKIGGNDPEWLKTVEVTVGGKKTPGNTFMDGANQDEAIEIWGKYSIGTVSREQAEAYLKASPDGSWLVRAGSDKSLVFSSRKGTAYTHQLVRLIGGAQLDRKKLLLKDKLPDVKPEPKTSPQSAPSKPPTSSRPKQTGSEDRERENEQMGPIVTKGSSTAQDMQPQKPNKPSARRPPTTRTPPKTTDTAPKRTGEQREAEGEQVLGLNPANDKLLRASPGWHGEISRDEAEKRLAGKEGGWLLRVGRDGAVAFSQNVKGKLSHALVTDDNLFRTVQSIMQTRATAIVRP